MSTRILRALLCFALCAVVPGCGDDGGPSEVDSGPGTPADSGPVTPMDDAGPEPDDASTEPGDAGPEPDDAALPGSDAGVPPADSGTVDSGIPDGPTITASGVVRELGAAGVGAVQANVEICAEGITAPCVTTDVTGAFAATGIPINTEFVLRFAKTGFMPALATVSTGTVDAAFNYYLVTPGTVSLLGLAIGVTPSDANGHLFVQLGEGDGAAGATVELVGGGRAYYTTASGLPDRALTSTSTTGTALFANVPPGEHIVRITPAPDRNCVLTPFAWAGSEFNTVRIVARAGHITSTNLICN